MVKKLAILAVIVALMAQAHVARAQASNNPNRAAWMQKLEAACQDKAQGAPCSFTRPNGNTAKGTCANHPKKNVLVCMTPQMLQKMQQRGGQN